MSLDLEPIRARLTTASDPDLTAYFNAQAPGDIAALIDEVEELRAEVACNRFDRAGLLPDWELTPYGAFLRNGKDHATCELRSIREQGYGWSLTVRGRQTFGQSPTARQAMRDAEQALRYAHLP